MFCIARESFVYSLAYGLTLRVLVVALVASCAVVLIARRSK